MLTAQGGADGRHAVPSVEVAESGRCLPALLLAAYLWVVLHWSFSAGERAGYVQKLSKKGWLCKTWEGEMALVSMPGTVRRSSPSPCAATRSPPDQRLDRREVALTYEQHIGIPTTCFGETGYS